MKEALIRVGQQKESTLGTERGRQRTRYNNLEIENHSLVSIQEDLHIMTNTRKETNLQGKHIRGMLLKVLEMLLVPNPVIDVNVVGLIIIKDVNATGILNIATQDVNKSPSRPARYNRDNGRGDNG